MTEAVAEEGGIGVGARLAGGADAITSGEWLRQWLVGGEPVAQVRRLLLSGATHAPSGFVLSSKTVCQCHNVTEQEVAAALAGHQGDPRERLEALKGELKCGTNCGSCLPELRSLAEKNAPKTRRMVA